MKNCIISTLLIYVIMLLSGCESDMPIEPEIDKTGESILGIDIAMEETSRGPITSTSFENGDEVFVIVIDPTNPDPLTITTKATYNGSAWELADKINLSGNISGVEWSRARIEVYYPYSIAANGYNSETRKIELTDMLQKQDDILYGSVETDKQKPNVTVNCRHALARLTIALKNNSDEKVDLSSISVKSNGLNLLESSGTLDYEGIHVSRSDNTNYLVYPYIKTYIQSGATYYFNFLLAPTTDIFRQKTKTDNMMEYVNHKKEKVFLEFGVNLWGKIIHFDIDATGWKEGCQYTYPVNLFKTSETEPDEDECVDLGLPSGTKWCSHNVGATYPWEYGGYYAWGETEEKNQYTLDSYKFWVNPGFLNIGTEISGTTFDVAHVLMGYPWRMPTFEQITELSDICTWEWTTRNGVNGNLVTGPNGSQIFLPAAGYIYGEEAFVKGSRGFYWTGSRTLIDTDVTLAYDLNFVPGNLFPEQNYYDVVIKGFSVRPVCK